MTDIVIVTTARPRKEEKDPEKKPKKKEKRKTIENKH